MRSLLLAAMLLLPVTAFAQDGSAAAARIAALEARITALEARIAELETRAPETSGLPSDAEFERTLGFMETFMRRFIGIAREFEADKAPDRT
jgi:type II secretory pathway component PulJ